MPPLLKGIVYLLALSALAHPLGQALPRRWFHWEKWPWAAASFEQGGRFWRRLGVHRWKDKVPDMSRLMGDMVKKKLQPQGRTDYVLLVQETCVAECVHFVLMLLAFGAFFFCRSGWIVFFVAIYILLGNLPFWIIQRYNRPRLVRLAQKAGKKA